MHEHLWIKFILAFRILDQNDFKSPIIKKNLNFPGLSQMFAKNGCLLKEKSAKMKYCVFKDVLENEILCLQGCVRGGERIEL